MSFYDLEKSGQRIKQLRKRCTMTQENLAEKLGVSVNAISQVERGVNGLSISMAVAMKDVFDCSLDYLLLGEETSTQMLKEQAYKFAENLMKFADQL